MKRPSFPIHQIDVMTKTSINTSKMLLLLKKFNNPHLKLKNIIHVAGTNGKGSVCQFISSILRNAGYSVNTYTSPHILEYNERFSLNGINASDIQINKIIKYVSEVVKYDQEISFFEATTLYAILLFQEIEADFNIFEVGLGGKFDATNIFLEPIISIITSISLDHTEILGPNLLNITAEKIAIAKNNCPVFTSNNNQYIIDFMQIYCDFIGTTFFYPHKNWNIIRNSNETFDYIGNKFTIKNITTNLKGDHQIENCSLSIAICEYLSNNFNINERNIIEAVYKTKWQGRMEEISINIAKNATFIIDGAHNVDGIKNLSYFVQKQNKFKNKIAICAFLNRKNISQFKQYINKDIFEKIFIMSPDERFFSTEYIINSIDIEGEEILSLDNLKNIIHLYDRIENLIIFFGSFYFLSYILDLKNDSRI